jgi:hypothetical protein
VVALSPHQKTVKENISIFVKTLNYGIQKRFSKPISSYLWR